MVSERWQTFAMPCLLQFIMLPAVSEMGRMMSCVVMLAAVAVLLVCFVPDRQNPVHAVAAKHAYAEYYVSHTL
jgi:hypothetical protein